MTRDQAILAVATAIGLDPISRVVVLALLADSGEVADGFLLGVAVAAVADRSGVSIRALWGRIADLEGLGVVSKDGRKVLVSGAGLAAWLGIDRAPRAHSVHQAHEPCSTCTVDTVHHVHTPCTTSTVRAPRARSKPSRTHTRDSLLVQEPKGSRTEGEREVVDHLESEREREVHTHPLLGDPDESAALPVIPLDPEAPQSLTPPVPAWAPVSIQAPTAASRGASSRTPVSYTGHRSASTPAAPFEAYTPGPAPMPMAGPASLPPITGLRRHLTPPPGGFVPEAFSGGQVALFREMCGDLERLLELPTLPIRWESAVRGLVGNFDEAAVRDSVLSIVTSVETGRTQHPQPHWLAQRAREAAKRIAAEAANPQRAAYSQKRVGRARADAMPSREWWNDPANDPAGTGWVDNNFAADAEGAAPRLAPQAFDFGDEGSST